MTDASSRETEAETPEAIETLPPANGRKSVRAGSLLSLQPAPVRSTRACPCRRGPPLGAVQASPPLRQGNRITVLFNS